MGRTFGPVARGHGSNSRSGRNFRRSPELNPRPWNFPKKSYLSAARGGASESSTRDLPMGLGQKGKIFPPTLSFVDFPLIWESFQPFPQIQSNLLWIRSDSFRIYLDSPRFVSYLIRSALILLLRLTVALTDLTRRPLLMWVDFDRLFFDPRRVLNPGRERIFGASYRLDQFAVVKSGDGPRVARRNGTFSGQLPRKIIVF